MKVYPIVEGHGEVEAAPVLLRRLLAEARCQHIGVGRPIRRTQSHGRPNDFPRMTKKQKLELTWIGKENRPGRITRHTALPGETTANEREGTRMKTGVGLLSEIRVHWRPFAVKIR